MWYKVFSHNKKFCSISLTDPDFLDNSFGDFFGAISLLENLRSFCFLGLSKSLCSCFTETAITVLCDLIRKNKLEVFSLKLAENMTPSKEKNLLLALKSSTVIKTIHLASPLETNVSILGEIMSKNQTLTDLAIGPYYSWPILTSDTAKIIKNFLSKNTTIKSFSLNRANVPITFLWDLLPKNILQTAVVASRGGGIKVQLADFVPLFWNFSLVDSALGIEYNTQGADAFAVHLSTNRGNLKKKCFFLFS
jgi:hypothetical protein